MDRILPFEGVENFRDYGDYATGVGRRIARGRLLRSAHHARATEADLARLDELRLATVVDLRRSVERELQPSRRAPGFAARVLEAPPHPDDQAEAPHMAFLRAETLTAETGRRFMLEAYRRIPFEAPHLDLFGRYFRALAEGRGPVLIHCAAGKDRTGVLAALTHRLIGVAEDDLVEDYLLTNQAARLEARTPELTRQIARLTGREPSPEGVLSFLGVHPDYLREAFDEIDRRCGSVEVYFETALRLEPEIRARVAERLHA